MCFPTLPALVLGDPHHAVIAKAVLFAQEEAQRLGLGPSRPVTTRLGHEQNHLYFWGDLRHCLIE